MPFVVRLPGAVEIDPLTRSFQELILRHESLRTTFAVVEDVPVQVIASSLDISIEIIDLSALPIGDREREMQRIAGEERTRPFDLKSGPLLRVRAVRMAAAGDILLLT